MRLMRLIRKYTNIYSWIELKYKVLKLVNPNKINRLQVEMASLLGANIVELNECLLDHEKVLMARHQAQQIDKGIK